MSGAGGRFFASLNYSSVNEDWRTEAAALSVTGRDSVLCVTGSGARPLDLLALGPRRVVAIDAGPAQSALLELKAAALRALPFEAYARFLGLAAASRRERLGLLDAVEPSLRAATAAFWRERRGVVARGVLWAGRWERYFRRVARLSRLLRPRRTARLFAFTDLEEQRRFVRARWDGKLALALARLALSPPAVAAFLRDPAFRARPGTSAGALVHERMTAHLTRVLARESFMASLVLRGTLPAADLPPHLTPEGAARIRARLDRLETVTADAVDWLASPSRSGRFDAFSLSDLPSYLSPERFERLIEAIVSRAAPAARFCIRLFLVRPELAPGSLAGLRRDEALERQLAEEDHAFVYDFLAGRVEGP